MFDSSIQNVVAAIRLVMKSPEAIPSDVERFDRLNGLLHVLRMRWENRSMIPVKSTRVAINDMDENIVIIDQALNVLEELAPQAGFTAHDWEQRRLTMEKILLHPLRQHRSELLNRREESEAKTRALLHTTTGQ